GGIGQITGAVPPRRRGLRGPVGGNRPRLRDGHLGLAAGHGGELPLVALLAGVALADLPGAHDASSVSVLSPGEVGGACVSALWKPSMATCICAEKSRAPDRVASRSRSRASRRVDPSAEG